MRVLHVTEAPGGGVMSSVLAMVEATPGVDHHLAYWPLRQHRSTGDDWSQTLSSVTRLPLDPVRLALSLRRLVRDLFPDVVHAHSSYAGLLVRSIGLEGPRVVYSPHCFAFERRDVGPALGRLVTGAERRLARHTDLVVAVSPHEVDLAADLGHAAVSYVPNRPLVGIGPVAEHRGSEPWRIATVGRITAQKDWRYYLHVKRYAEEQLGLDARWEWLGAGDPAGERQLRAAGVEVSGWLPRAELVSRLGTAQTYLHTAAWEGAPVSVLEAAALGLPLAVRAIGATTSTRVPGTAADVPGLARLLVDLRAPERWESASAQASSWAARHSAALQGDLLSAAYRDVLGLASAVAPATALDAVRAPRIEAAS